MIGETNSVEIFFFNNIIANPGNKLHNLLPSRNIYKYNLRKA